MVDVRRWLLAFAAAGLLGKDPGPNPLPGLGVPTSAFLPAEPPPPTPNALDVVAAGHPRHRQAAAPGFGASPTAVIAAVNAARLRAPPAHDARPSGEADLLRAPPAPPRAVAGPRLARGLAAERTHPRGHALEAIGTG